MRLGLPRIITFAQPVTALMRAATMTVEYVTGSGIDLAMTAIANSVPRSLRVSRSAQKSAAFRRADATFAVLLGVFAPEFRNFDATQEK